MDYTNKISEKIGRVKNLRKQISEHNDNATLPDLKSVKKVLIINSSSRSGSSLLYAILRKIPGIYSLTGEAAPFYKLNTDFDPAIIFRSENISDNVIDTMVDFKGLRNDILADLSFANGNNNINMHTDFDSYANDIIMRFLLQWADIEFDIKKVKKIIFTIAENIKKLKATVGVEEFYIQLLGSLIRIYPQINPYYYDLTPELVALHFPEYSKPFSPPGNSIIIEEPPFVLQAPRVSPSPDHLENNILFQKIQMI